MLIPTFTTNRLILKEITHNDYGSYTEHFVDYEVMRHLAAVIPWPYPEHGVRDYIEQDINPYLGKNKWLWGIFLKGFPSELIGAIELRLIGNPDNRGFWLGRKFWGQGIMSEALIPITDYTFSTLGFQELILTNAVGNQASHKIKLKMGAHLLYTESAKFVDPKIDLREVWGFSKDNWKKFQETNS